MNSHSIRLLIIFLTMAALGCATQVTMNFADCQAGVCTPGTEPFLLTGGAGNPTRNSDVRYVVPSWSSLKNSIWYIDSISIDFQVYDDGDAANEGGRGTLNVDNAGYGATTFGWTSTCHTCNLNGYTAASPENISVTITDPTALAAILVWFRGHSGHFQYTVTATSGTGNPAGGDFYLAGIPTITLDYTAVPEPVSLSLVGLGLAGFAALRKRVTR